MAISIDFSKILFFDIETVSQKPVYQELDERMQELWGRKARHVLRQYDETPEPEAVAAAYQDRAAIFAEFGKVCTISMGILSRQEGHEVLRIKSFSGSEERTVLTQFKELLDQFYYDVDQHFLCGHNIKEFDVPYLARRMMILGIPLPNLLNLHGKKPWETKYLVDTMDLWKFGDIKHFTSLDLLAACFGIPTPKGDIDGSRVGSVFWVDQDLDRIQEYCQKDVVTVAQILRKFSFLPLFTEDQIKMIT